MEGIHIEALYQLRLWERDVKFLKTATDRAKKIGGVKDLLHREVGGYEKARSQREIHASALTKEVEYCPREVRLMELLEKKQKDQWIPMTLRLTFDEGRMKQHALNNLYLSKFMVGSWYCGRCRTTVAWSKGKPKSGGMLGDSICPGHEWEYREPFFIDPISEAQGAVDSLIELPGHKKLRMCEVKIMATSMWPPVAPLAEHKLRTQFYLSLMARSEHKHKHEIDLHEASVLYWLRGHGKKDENGDISPFKEFVVKRDDDSVEYLFKKATELTVARGSGVLPNPICPHQMCPRAEKCPVSKECFSVGIIIPD